MTPQIIVNADDFGASADINAAVMLAHREGIVTATSLMVTGDKAGEAVALARETPSLAVGLHLVLSEGRPALPPAEVPHLVDGAGRLSRSGFQAGVRYALSRPAQAELEREMRAQFERFAATGLRLAHVDGHMHLHIVPGVFGIAARLAEEYGAGGIRLPRDDLWLALQHSRRRAGAQIGWAIAFGLVCRWCAGRLHGSKLRVADRVYGQMQTGEMDERYVLRVLRSVNVPVAELYFHPSLGPASQPLGPNSGDLQTLLSPAVRQVIAERGLRLTNYADLVDEA
jgi:hopanoid biosynthesis associated protein HpnK